MVITGAALVIIKKWIASSFIEGDIHLEKLLTRDTANKHVIVVTVAVTIKRLMGLSFRKNILGGATIPARITWEASSFFKGKVLSEKQLPGYTTNEHELNIGDPARNILQMIFQNASRNPSKSSHMIKRVLKVKNSEDVLESYEEYREMVKNHSYEQRKRHPRSIVDGNELLRFYGPTMSCCSKESKRVSELCRDPACRICRVIQCNFDTECTKNYGIRLSTISDEFGDNIIAFSKKMERAVIVCRIIAGTVTDKVDGIHEEECDSNGREGMHI
ncbi:unnamed protein product [Dovyalis caffra]|uniref:Uncharacterized protein n=1 Tax=Dovyalis caffra TaxID=77055 RepID=A0AAV1QU15_9ROSI|nr:unnamed protein product [Dovyalis caffra]